MDKRDNKNPLLSGLVNVLLPGSSHLYVNRDWGGFAGGFLLGMVGLTAAILAGDLIQRSRGYSMPQGICMGVLLMVLAAGLFASGYQTARIRNGEINAAIFYNAKRHVSHESPAIKHAKIQKMRDEGLISAQEYEDKNIEVDADNNDGVK